MKKIATFFLNGILVGTMLCVSFVSIANFNYREIDFGTRGVLNGKLTRALEESYDGNIFIKDLGVSLWTAVEYRVFNEGKKGLVIGKDEWFFTAEEFESKPESTSYLSENIEFIKWVDNLLEQKNIKLVVVPVPAKARLYHDKLGARKPDLLHRNLYNELIQSLDAGGLVVVDTLPGMQIGRVKQEQFLRTDTHWTPSGADNVAKLTAKNIPGKFYSSGGKVFRSEPLSPQVLEGDLLEFLPLNSLFESLLPVPEHVISYSTYDENSEGVDDLFTDSIETVALVGTSYSADTVWDFEGSLKRELETDIINFAQKAKGPIAPMYEFIQDHLEQMPDLELVIWEIPERYLVVDYQAGNLLALNAHSDKSLLAKN